MIVLVVLISEGPEKVREEGGPLVLEKTVGEDMSSEAAKFCLEQKGEVDS